MFDFPLALFLVVCGFIITFVSTVLGLGGGWIITPMLHLMGLPMPMAVGTSLFTLLGSSFTALWKHYTFKRIDLKLSVILCIGSVGGIQLSSYILKKMPAESISENLRWLFIGFLTLMLFSLFFPSSQANKKIIDNRLGFQPVLIVIIGGIAGVLGGLLGVGGGFIITPLLIYGLSLPKEKVMAASTMSILLASLTGTATYWPMHLIRFDYGCSLIIGAMFGGYWASVVLTKFKDIHVKNLFIQSLLLMISSLVLKQLNYNYIAKILVLCTAASLFIRMMVIIREHNKLIRAVTEPPKTPTGTIN